jgi:predicted transposase YbfD/YdcC
MATKKVKQAQEAETQSVLGYFANLPDPRRNNENKRHQLIDIIAIAILATICGANHFTEMEQFGKANEDFLRSFLELPNGIPSHDTIGEVFARLDASEFRKCFISWVETIRMATEGETIAFDGKTMRRSYDRSGRKGALHMVSAWATRNRLTLGQVKVDEKSNEIKAIPELLRLLYVKGCIVTIDAIGTQKEIAEQIRQQEADYVLALKDNQPHLRAEVEGIFEAECAAQMREEKGKNAGAVEPNGVIETAERGHGRFETRRVYSIEAPEWLRHKERWRDLKSLIMVEATRGINDQVSIEKRYYISSLVPDANQANEVVRSHWGIENSLHWVLDVAFREDDLRVRVGNAPENLALVRKLTHNLLEQETSVKAGIQSKRLNAAWDRKYLLKILGVTHLTS